MNPQLPKISLIIASYSPGDAVWRVIDSLAGQTMPQDEFEVIFVDDGSPDDTFARLQSIASSRPNMSVHQIENSGWPSRPRNVGIEHARGEYLMFMDHDDSLYSEGLQRAYEYAHANDADVLSPKESKTNDAWWGMRSSTAGNIPNVLAEEGIHRMLPMVPHKLYRRQMFIDHNIRFPEGARVLWEDWFINLDAFKHSKVVSVLADSPVYLWHASATNSSRTFRPERVDFWDRLEDMMEHTATALAGPDHRDDLTFVMAHQVSKRVINRCVRLISASPDAVPDGSRDMALLRARELLDRYATDEVYARLHKKHQAQLHLMRAGRMELIQAFHEADLALQARVTITSARWDDGVLAHESEARWQPKDPKVPGFVAQGSRILRAVDQPLRNAIPPELLDLTDDSAELLVQLGIRGRAEYVTWDLPFDPAPAVFEPNPSGALSLVQRGSGVVDLSSAALGRPLDSTVWDVRMRTEWVGMERKGRLGYSGAVLPAVLAGRTASAFRNASGGLTIDLAGRVRTFVSDAAPRGSAGPITAFSVALKRVSVFAAADVDMDPLFAIDEDLVPSDDVDDTQARLAELAAAGRVTTRMVSDGQSARLTGSADLAPGRYALYSRRQSKLYRTPRSIVVDPAGLAKFI